MVGHSGHAVLVPPNPTDHLSDSGYTGASRRAQQESGKAVDASDTASLGGAEDAQDLRWPVYTLADAGDGGGWGAWDATRIGNPHQLAPSPHFAALHSQSLPCFVHATTPSSMLKRCERGCHAAQNRHGQPVSQAAIAGQQSRREHEATFETPDP